MKALAGLKDAIKKAAAGGEHPVSRTKAAWDAFLAIKEAGEEERTKKLVEVIALLRVALQAVSAPPSPSSPAAAASGALAAAQAPFRYEPDFGFLGSSSPGKDFVFVVCQRLSHEINRETLEAVRQRLPLAQTAGRVLAFLGAPGRGAELLEAVEWAAGASPGRAAESGVFTELTRTLWLLLDVPEGAEAGPTLGRLGRVLEWACGQAACVDELMRSDALAQLLALVVPPATGAGAAHAEHQRRVSAGLVGSLAAAALREGTAPEEALAALRVLAAVLEGAGPQREALLEAMALANAYGALEAALLAAAAEPGAPRLAQALDLAARLALGHDPAAPRPSRPPPAPSTPSASWPTPSCAPPPSRTPPPARPCARGRWRRRGACTGPAAASTPPSSTSPSPGRAAAVFLDEAGSLAPGLQRAALALLPPLAEQAATRASPGPRPHRELRAVARLLASPAPPSRRPAPRLRRRRHAARLPPAGPKFLAPLLASSGPAPPPPPSSRPRRLLPGLPAPAAFLAAAFGCPRPRPRRPEAPGGPEAAAAVETARNALQLVAAVLRADPSAAPEVATRAEAIAAGIAGLLPCGPLRPPALDLASLLAPTSPRPPAPSCPP
eukprot:tig00001181_g7449.t1